MDAQVLGACPTTPRIGHILVRAPDPPGKAFSGLLQRTRHADPAAPHLPGSLLQAAAGGRHDHASASLDACLGKGGLAVVTLLWLLPGIASFCVFSRFLLVFDFWDVFGRREQDWGALVGGFEWVVLPDVCCLSFFADWSLSGAQTCVFDGFSTLRFLDVFGDEFIR